MHHGDDLHGEDLHGDDLHGDDLHGDDDHWTLHAACRGHDPEVFYPVSFAGSAVEDVGRAKAVCAGCAVRADCLSWALRAGEPDGVWGGTTPEERRYLRHAAVR